MKILKKISVCLLILVITLTSVTLSYKKANEVQAVSLGITLGASLLLGCALLGAYYVANPDAQEDLKQSLSDYVNTSEEVAKTQYEFNKTLFNEFCEQTISAGGGSAAINTADGKSYTVQEMYDSGFPDFEKWDNEMQKQSKKSSKNFGNVWDMLSFGLDLIDFLLKFFDDDSDVPSASPGGLPQQYYTGDDSYKNFENKTIEINMYGLQKGVEKVDYSPLENNYYVNTFIAEFERNCCTYSVEEFEALRYFAVLKRSGASYTEYIEEGSRDTAVYSYLIGAYLYSGSSYNRDSVKWSTNILANKYAYRSQYYYGAYHEEEGINKYYMNVFSSYGPKAEPIDFYFLSVNVPLFETLDEGLNYVATGKASTALNLPPTVSVIPTAVPTSKPVTPVVTYINNFNGKNVTVNDVTNINYYVVNYWDGSSDLTQVINNYYNNTADEDEELVTTVVPVPTLVDSDGSNTTNNYIINITNILEPIKVTIENVYNFFQIDTESVSNAWDLNYIPAADFNLLIEAFDKMENVFPSDEYEIVVDESNVNSGQLDVEEINEENNNATSQQILSVVYPKITFDCPKILQPYWDSDVIVLCDFSKYAIYFVRFRAFINITLWIGLLFYLMREFRVTFTIH